MNISLARSSRNSAWSLCVSLQLTQKARWLFSLSFKEVTLHGRSLEDQVNSVFYFSMTLALKTKILKQRNSDMPKKRVFFSNVFLKTRK